MAALVLLMMAKVVALKVAEVAAAAPVTDAGTVRVEGLLFDRATLAPPLRAGWAKVTVQVLDAFGPRLVGLHAREETRVEGVKLMPVLAEVPLNAAVTVAVWELEIVVAVAWKAA